MTKYNDYLTEVVYQIDDIIYDFYKKSNELIATKRNHENLIDFRDKTISTVNDMNIRALEIISSLKKDDIVEQRVEILLDRNTNILESSLTVINNTPAKGDLFNEMKTAAKEAIVHTNKALNDFQDSDTFANIKRTTEDGYTRLKDAIKNVSQDDRVQKGIQTAKEKSKELLEAGEKVFHEGEEKVKSWVKASKEKAKDVKDDVEDVYEDVKDEASDFYEDVKVNVDEKYEASKSKIEAEIDDKKEEFQEYKEKLEEKIHNKEDALEEEVENLQAATKELGEKAKKAVEEFIEHNKEEGNE